MSLCCKLSACQGRIHPSAPETKILMDTGSSISIIKPYNSRIQSVDGTLLDILRATDATVEFTSISVTHSVVVANIIPSVLMGVWTSSKLTNVP